MSSSRVRPVVERVLNEHFDLSSTGVGQCACGVKTGFDGFQEHLTAVITEAVENEVLHWPKRSPQNADLFPGPWQQKENQGERC